MGRSIQQMQYRGIKSTHFSCNVIIQSALKNSNRSHIYNNNFIIEILSSRGGEYYYHSLLGYDAM